MHLLISCAKTMTDGSPVVPPFVTEPAFRREAAELASEMAAFTTDDLAHLLGVNPRIAAENRQRYLRFHDGAKPALPALLAYTGIVFKHIDPASFSDADFIHAQRHLSIASFLYGLLRPLDGIRPYRLEGNVPLRGRDTTLFDYWRPQLTDLLLENIRSDDGVLINLASGEMRRLFDWNRITRSVRIITPEFRIREGDRLRTVVVYTKMCRGEMTRHILRGRIAGPEALKAFAWEGFRFDATESRGDKWVFAL